jgi:plasmid stability protein
MMVPERLQGVILAALTLKNLPDELLRELRAAAVHERRSLNQQVIHLLDTAIRAAPLRAAAARSEVEAQVAGWRRLAGRWQSDEDRVTEAKGIAGRRSAGRKVAL